MKGKSNTKVVKGERCGICGGRIAKDEDGNSYCIESGYSPVKEKHIEK